MHYRSWSFYVQRRIQTYIPRLFPALFMICRKFLIYSAKNLPSSSLLVYRPRKVPNLKTPFYSFGSIRIVSQISPFGRKSAMATPSKIQLLLSDCGIFHTSGITKESAAKASEVLQENHNHHHVFFNQDGFHSTYTAISDYAATEWIRFQSVFS